MVARPLVGLGDLLTDEDDVTLGEADTETLGVNEGLGDIPLDALSDREALADGDVEAEGDAVRDGLALGDVDAEGDTLSDADLLALSSPSSTSA